jgi:Holliday junction DNA helicase RuvA
MFDYIRGILAEKSVSAAVVEAVGVGYHLQIPLSTFERLPEVNKEVKLYTHHHVREDTQKLFGFYSTSERELFRLLLGITMVGPKVALSVLSGISIDKLVHDIRTSNISRLKSISGIGPKTAERLVMELKGKLNEFSAAAPPDEETPSKAGHAVKDARNEAFTAMLSLGYNDKQIEKAFQRVDTVLDSTAPAEEWIKKALQVI